MPIRRLADRTWEEVWDLDRAAVALLPSTVGTLGALLAEAVHDARGGA